MTDFEQKKIFSANITSLLNERRLSQREVAHSIGVSAQTFNTWCRGVAIPRMDKIQKLADYFHIDKSSLIDPPDTSNSPLHHLTASERSLIDHFRQLNDEGQEMAIEHVAYLVSTGRYIKTDQPKLVEEA